MSDRNRKDVNSSPPQALPIPSKTTDKVQFKLHVVMAPNEAMLWGSIHQNDDDFLVQALHDRIRAQLAAVLKDHQSIRISSIQIVTLHEVAQTRRKRSSGMKTISFVIEIVIDNDLVNKGGTEPLVETFTIEAILAGMNPTITMNNYNFELVPDSVEVVKRDIEYVEVETMAPDTIETTRPMRTVESTSVEEVAISSTTESTTTVKSSTTSLEVPGDIVTTADYYSSYYEYHTTEERNSGSGQVEDVTFEEIVLSTIVTGTMSDRDITTEEQDLHLITTRSIEKPEHETTKSADMFIVVEYQFFNNNGTTI